MEKFIEEAKDSKLIFVVSPYWYEYNQDLLSKVKCLCDEHKVPFYNFSNSPKYSYQDKYFSDGGHLNSCGADEFTK